MHLYYKYTLDLFPIMKHNNEITEIKAKTCTVYKYFLDTLQEVATMAEGDYACRCGHVTFTVESVVNLGRRFLQFPQKPRGPSCYYLVLLHTAHHSSEEQAIQIAETWSIHAKLESLKGTYLHKKIELYINAMVRPMQRSQTLRVAVEDLVGSRCR